MVKTMVSTLKPSHSSTARLPDSWGGWYERPKGKGKGKSCSEVQEIQNRELPSGYLQQFAMEKD